MGLFDYVACDVDLPGSLAIAGREFQCRSLYRVLGRFTITLETRLIYHSVRYESAGHPDPLPRLIAIPERDIDLDFHGDILLTPEEDELKKYVVRFTHGAMEWVRPYEEFSQAEQMLALRRNLEN
jgi:hypothetical protein